MAKQRRLGHKLRYACSSWLLRLWASRHANSAAAFHLGSQRRRVAVPIKRQQPQTDPLVKS